VLIFNELQLFSLLANYLLDLVIIGCYALRMRATSIEWTNNTFNPWIGCTKVSEGCANCYAEMLMDTRYGRVKWGKGNPRHLTNTWKQPLAWNRAAEQQGIRKRVFCASLADVFDAEVPKAWRTSLWSLIRDCSNLDWQLLTKRPENIEKFLPDNWNMKDFSHVWLGTTVENQKRADERVEILTTIPASIHFLSAEPLLGPIEFKSLEHIEWVIVGGESGHGARSMDMGWAMDIVQQCADNGIACFVKQLGKRPVVASPDDDEVIPWEISDAKGKNVEEWWEELRVREFPEFELVS